MTTNRKTNPTVEDSRADELEAWMKADSRAAGSKVDRATDEVKEAIHTFLQAFADGKTSRTLAEFHKWLSQARGVSFGVDTLRTYVAQRHAALWEEYTSKRHGR